jgi:hypothetical protein
MHLLLKIVKKNYEQGFIQKLQTLNGFLID